MKVSYNSTTGGFLVEVEGDVKTVVEQLAEFNEIALADKCCGDPKCQSKNIGFHVRDIDGNKYYERRCNDCGARLCFGQTKKGGKLFPKRKLMPNGQPDMKKGSFGPHRGWSHFRGDDAAEE